MYKFIVSTNKLKSWQLAALAVTSLNFSCSNLSRIGGRLGKQAEALFKYAAPVVRLANASTYLCIILNIFLFFFASGFSAMQNYPLAVAPIDVIIPCAGKDVANLEMVIEGIRANGVGVRRIIVVSPHQVTDLAEWFNEKRYPFSKQDVALHLWRGDSFAAERFLQTTNRTGWYYQQLLKLYAPLVIPEISSNVLIVDADTIFLNRVDFLDSRGGGLYNIDFAHHAPYFRHACGFLPGLHRKHRDFSGITHHMLFQRPILEDLLNRVEKYHKRPAWQAFCRCVDPGEVRAWGSGASEYEIYFNFAFLNTRQVRIRPLKWANIDSLEELENYKNNGFHYVSYHRYEEK